MIYTDLKLLYCLTQSLLSLHHPFCNTSATEVYPPNVLLCQETIAPLGIEFREADAGGMLPFTANSFDVIINRHGDFNVVELYRVLKPNGIFITEQVGALVWFAHIIEWEFPGFAVEKYLSELYAAKDILEKCGCIEGRIHRFMLITKKK